LASNFSQYVPRRPRHATNADAQLRVEIQRPAGGSADLLQAELLDFSRHGFRLRTPVALALGEPIVMRLCNPKSGFRLEVPATVRWQRAEDGRDHWLLGCQTVQEVDWAILGELFLQRILATESGTEGTS
jgi:hypothetical protein